MAIVVCRYCNKLVRYVDPPRTTYKIKGVCSAHFHLLREEIHREIVCVNAEADCLESALKCSK